MGMELTRYEFKDELTSANLNAKQSEIQNYLNQAQEAVNKAQALIDNLNTKVAQNTSDVGIIYQRLNDKVERKPLNTLSVEDLNNANFPYSYETNTNYGIDMGLPSRWVHVKYFRHDGNNGHGTQVAYKLIGGTSDVADTYKMWTIAVRNSYYINWSPWEEVATSKSVMFVPIVDANLAIKNMKSYYLQPNALNKPPEVYDGPIFVLSFDQNWVSQLLLDWRTNRLFTRACSQGTWSTWIEK